MIGNAEGRNDVPVLDDEQAWTAQRVFVNLTFLNFYQDGEALNRVAVSRLDGGLGSSESNAAACVTEPGCSGALSQPEKRGLGTAQRVLFDLIVAI
jgi:hypothetical protein